jgi:hypothetical protein
MPKSRNWRERLRKLPVTDAIKVLSIFWTCSNLLATFFLVSAQEIYGNTDAPLIAEALGTKVHLRHFNF